jgi:hypothetical protein
MSKSKSGKYRGLRRGTLVTGMIGTLVAVAAGVTPAVAAAGTLALTSTSGPTGGGNTLIATFATAPTSPNTTTFNTSTAVNFVAPSGTTAATCPATFTAPGTNLGATGTNLRVLTTTKLAVTVPTGVTHSGSAASTKYKMCVYNSSTVATTSTLVASADYTVGLKPTLAASSYISPTSGPALGGTTITVTGTNFVANTTTAPNNTTATLGGIPLTNIVVASGGTSFTATTPPHVAEVNTLLVVTTPGGSVSTLAATTTKADDFDFTNGIVVTPNTAPNSKTTTTDLSITGVGFSAMDFSVSATGVDPDHAGAHIFLSRGRYADNVVSGTTKINGPVAECIDVIVVTDTELLCSLPLFQTRGTDGDFTFTRTASVVTTSGSAIVRSVAGNFTQNDVGAAISVPSDTQIPASTTIASVESPFLATLSANALATATSVTATITLAAAAALTSPTASDASTTLTSSTITASDVGKAVSGTGIAANTFIKSATSGSAVLSAKTTSAIVAADTVSIRNGVPVTSDAYVIHVVSSGTAGASINDEAYSQSIVSSAATFTVSDY